jgi:hypothetical protein
VSLRIYVEGGGDRTVTSALCRRAFSEFFKKIVPEGRRPKVIACGSRNDTFDDFRIALLKHPEAVVLLLVDAEGPVHEGSSVWAHLKSRDRWEQPTRATDENAHLMVQCMEAWILADERTLKDYFGQGFSTSALPRRPDIEQIQKAEVFQALKDATRHVKTKGEYHKTRHGFDLMTRIDPEKVRRASPHAERLCMVLLRETAC